MIAALSLTGFAGIEQAVVELDPGAVLLAMLVAGRQVSQGNRLQCRSGINLALGQLDDVEQLVGGQGVGARTQLRVAAVEGLCCGD